VLPVLQFHTNRPPNLSHLCTMLLSFFTVAVSLPSITGVIHKGRLQKYSINRSCALLSAFVGIGPYPLSPPVDVLYG